MLKNNLKITREGASVVLEGFELEEVKPDFNKEKQTEVIGYGDALNDRSELKNKGGGVGMMTRDINECLLAEEVETTEELPLTFNTLFFLARCSDKTFTERKGLYYGQQRVHQFLPKHGKECEVFKQERNSRSSQAKYFW